MFKKVQSLVLFLHPPTPNSNSAHYQNFSKVLKQYFSTPATACNHQSAKINNSLPILVPYTQLANLQHSYLAVGNGISVHKHQLHCNVLRVYHNQVNVPREVIHLYFVYIHICMCMQSEYIVMSYRVWHCIMLCVCNICVALRSDVLYSSNIYIGVVRLLNCGTYAPINILHPCSATTAS